MLTLHRGKYLLCASRALMPPHTVTLAIAPFAVTQRTMELPSGHIVKFVKVPPSLKYLIRGPQGETLQKLQEDTYTSIKEKDGGFEATGIPYDIERLEAEVRQLLGDPAPKEWMREYKDLVDADVLLRPKHDARKNKEDAVGAESSGPVNRYFFLVKTKAMWDLLSTVINVNILQKETNAKVIYELKQAQILVRVSGQEADVRNAFCKLLSTVRDYTKYATTQLEVLRNQTQQASMQRGYLRAKLALLQGTCIDRSATESSIEGIERSMKRLETKAHRLQLDQGLFEQSIPEAPLMRELYDPKIEETKAQLRAMEAKVEESKQRYEEAMKTAKDNPESNATPGHDDVDQSTTASRIEGIERSMKPLEAKVEESKQRYEEAMKTANDDPESNAKSDPEGLRIPTDSEQEALAQNVPNEPTTVLPCGHIVKFVKILPPLKYLVTGPQGETLQKLQEDTHTSITEKFEGFVATGIPYDIERFETAIRQLLGEPVPLEWVREYEDLADAKVLLRIRPWKMKNQEDAGSAESSGPVNRYFFLVKTKAMCDLLSKAVNEDMLQNETNVVYENRPTHIVVRMNGAEADVRNAFRKLLNTVRAYPRRPATELEALNQIELARMQTCYWRAKLELLEVTCVDRSATESKIDSIEQNIQHLEAKAQRLQKLSEHPISETGELCGPKIDETATAQLRAMKAKAEKFKQRYEKAMKTTKDDPESNAKSGHEDLPNSTSPTTVRDNTQFAAIQLEVLRNQIQLARAMRAYWRAKLALLQGTCVDRSAIEGKIERIEQNMKSLEAKAQRLQREQRRSEQSIPEAALTRKLCDPKIEKAKAQLHVWKASAEEFKQRYEEAMKTTKGDPESNGQPGHEDLPSSPDSTPEALALKVEKLRLALAQVQTALAGHHIDFWRAKAQASRTGDDAELCAVLANSVKKMDSLINDSHRIEDKLNRTKDLLPQCSHISADGNVLVLREQVLEAQLRLNGLVEKALVWQLRYNDARMQKLAQEEKCQSQEQHAQA